MTSPKENPSSPKIFNVSGLACKLSFSLSVFLKEKVVGVITCFSPAIILITVSLKEEIQTFTPHQKVLNKLASRRLII